MSAYVTLPILEETGFAVLEPDDSSIDPAEWRELEYTPWRSSGITRFAPLTSFSGELECNAFWNRTPPRTDKDGVWIAAQSEKAPALVRLAQQPGAVIGRCRVIELQPNEYADAVHNLHQDDNNRLNPEGTGWIVRGLCNLTDDADSMLLLREDRFDPASEVRIPLAAGTRVIVDTQRLWHAVWHRGPAPRYALITSWESGPELARHIAAHHGTTTVQSPPVDQRVVDAAQTELHRRIEEQRRIVAEQGRALTDTGFDDA
ncbi:hypothetical protein AB1K54_15315 [Microbacterium sp. BWT-B31]|uniref:hypothetical protein n=1 Tax=Microbacterium sp. BWT-B31 TaxID=3232072 RepID=UPI003527FE12